MYDVNSLVAVNMRQNQLLLETVFTENNPDRIKAGLRVTALSDLFWHDQLDEDQWEAYVEAMLAAKNNPVEVEDGSLDPVTVGTAIFQSNDAMFENELADVVFAPKYGAALRDWAIAKATMAWLKTYGEKTAALLQSNEANAFAASDAAAADVGLAVEILAAPQPLDDEDTGK